MHLRSEFEQGQVGSLGPADHMCDPEILRVGGRVEMKKPHLHGVLREVRNTEEQTSIYVKNISLMTTKVCN